MSPMLLEFNIIADKIAGNAVDASVVRVAVIVNGTAIGVAFGAGDVVADEVSG